ncbi:MAG: GDSL-type esterase/lipase family protein [Oculatellaceae cyanobacterium bins.114]|nr:GDSL-type esterase/lipase family protein [Oculatellaceae cyanobacterium bins.114]
MTLTSSAFIKPSMPDSSTYRSGISNLFEQSPVQSTATSLSLRLSSSSNSDPAKAVTTTSSRDAIAPRARLAVTNVATASTTYSFRVTYSDRGKLNKRTINSRDILVSGVNGFRQLAQLVSTRLNRAGTTAVATYRINAAGGTWDSTDNGAYTVSMQRAQVSDLSRNFVRAGRLGGFQVSVPGTQDPPPVDLPPTASLTASNFTPQGTTTYSFNVTYADDNAISVASLGNGDVQVTGPGGFNQSAVLTAVSPSGDGTPRTVTYRINAPGGSWDTADIGTYTVSLVANQVSDTSNNFAVAGTLGTFTVVTELQAPTVSGFSAPTIAADSGDAQFTVTYADNDAIAFASLTNGDVQVTGPNGFSQLATLVSVNTTGNGTPRTATYRIGAPGGSWSAVDNGTYTVSVLVGQVSDVNGNAIAAANAGTFTVTLSGTDDTLNGSGTNNNTVTGGTGNDTVSYAALSQGISANLSTNTVVKSLYGNTILPLGDSITSGQHTNAVPGAYRVELYNNYISDGFINLDLVGTQQNGPSSNFDQDHEGYPGRTIDQLRTIVSASGYFDAFQQSNVVLLMIGTNDTGGSFVSQTEMTNDLTALLNEITLELPNTQILVSTIPPITDDPTRNSRRSTYNSDIQTVVNSFVSQGKKVARVNAGGGLANGDIGSDGIHPTSSGYNKLGDLWYDFLTDRDTLSSIENVIGTNFVDTIVGGTGANIITGGAGGDRITGGGGADTFVYRSAAEGGDTITDFTSSDFIQISASGFGGGLAVGSSLSEGIAAATGVFVNGATPVGTNANFLFSSGILSFDADGVGAGAAVAIANLGNVTLTASQFNIVA